MDYQSLIEKIENMSQENFEKFFIDLHQQVQKNPLKNFVESPLFMNTKPTPGQRVLFKLVFKQKLDSEQKHWIYEETQDENEDFSLEKVWLTETELYEFYTGKKYDFNKCQIVNDISLILGRRSGKTLCSSILAIYYVIRQNWKKLLGKKRVATALVVSHTKEFSDEIIEEVKALIDESPILNRLINHKKKNTQSTINLKVPFLDVKNNKTVYSYVRIRTNAASSKSSRGSACPIILCDEIAFWGSDLNAKESDKQIMEALTPSMLQFGSDAILIKLSSPFIRSGVLWNDYERWEKGELPDSCLVLKAPSWAFNTLLGAPQFKQEWEKKKNDPESFSAEYRAVFLDSASAFFPGELLRLLIIKGASFVPPEPKGQDVFYSAAIDAAFKSDRFVFSIVGHTENKMKQYVQKVWNGSKKNPVQVDEVAEFIYNVCRSFGISRIFADQYAFEPLRQSFAKYGLEVIEATFSNPFKHKIYYNLKNLVLNKTIDLLDDSELITELEQIRVERSPTGTLKIGHPPGGKDDRADALALAAFQTRKLCERFNSDLVEMVIKKDYNIQVDKRTGLAVTAPSVEMLAGTHGMPADAMDTTDLVRRNPKTGEYELIIDDEDDLDDDGGSDGCDFII